MGGQGVFEAGGGGEDVRRAFAAKVVGRSSAGVGEGFWT